MSLAYSNAPVRANNQMLSSSAIRLSGSAVRQPARPAQPTTQRSQPALVITQAISRRFLGRATMRAVVVLTLGAVGIIIAGLQLSIMIQQGSYQLAGLKAQMRDLTTTNQILDEQVRSLSSDQNLANAAATLGMVTNANPVYLRLSDGKVIGHPKVAGAGSGVKIGKNVVPNAALVATTTSSALKEATKSALAASQAAKAAAAASASAALHPAASVILSKASNDKKAPAGKTVASAKTAPVAALAASGIPVSPTH